MASDFAEAFQKWCKRSAIPPPPDFWIRQCFDPLWQDHQVRVTSHLTSKSAKQIQDLFPESVFHNEDEKASSLLIYCPVHYHQSIHSTFTDAKVFCPLLSSPLSTLELTKAHLTNLWGKTYPWSMGRGNTLPSAYILPKGKKYYKSGRPIISFFGAPFRPMLNALAKLLYQLVPEACPNHFALGDVYTLLSHLKTFAQSHPSIAPLRISNQDLAGFFISIDVPRFLTAWNLVLHFLTHKMDLNPEAYFSIFPNKANNPGDLIKGRTFRSLNVTRKLKIGDITELIISSLQMQSFSLGSNVYTQVQDSPMGSPLSPALCLMVVSVHEEIWHSTYSTYLFPSFKRSSLR